jgi:RNA polymerase sigma-70 factor (ECF subfamily)
MARHRACTRKVRISESADAADERGAARGGPERFEEFFEATYEPVLRALYLVAGSRHEAEDAAQEAFVRMYERWDDLRERPNPAGYAYRTALNVHRSRLRRLRVAARRMIRTIPPDPLKASEDRDELRRVMKGLPRGQREALVLVEWLGMSDEEAGQVLGVAPVTIRVRISRARQALRTDTNGGERDE